MAIVFKEISKKIDTQEARGILEEIAMAEASIEGKFWLSMSKPDREYYLRRVERVVKEWENRYKFIHG